MCESSGTPPHTLTVWETHPGWDWLDVDIMRAWGRLTESLCPHCGRPEAVHADDRVEDYHTAYATCTATEALDRAQARFADSPQGRSDKAAAKKGRSPERARRWFTYTDTEGLPSFGAAPPAGKEGD